MAARRRRLLWLLLVPLALGAILLLRGRGEATQFTTAVVDRGDVVEVVGATGALEAVTTVQIGSQVSGTIESLNADFNSTVKKGQIIARLDASILEARLGQAQANLLAAKANVERARSSARRSWRRRTSCPRAISTRPGPTTTERPPSSSPTRRPRANPWPPSTRPRWTSATPSSTPPSTGW
jgi:multidrug efflux pump subunit AcrA (membrane-fusion protein)